MSDTPPKSLGRRQALIHGSLAVGSLAGLGAAGSVEARSGGGKWDHETDVVCVGSGAAACAAGVTAASRGAKVIMVEKMPLPGGTTAKSGGVAWVPNNGFLRQRGIKDERADCLRFMARLAHSRDYDPTSPTLGVAPDEYKLLEAYYDNASGAIEYFEKLGAVTFKEFTMWDANRLATDYSNHLPENKVPRGRALETAEGEAPRAGAALAGRMEAWLTAKGVPLLLEHEVTRVVKEGDRVIGVEARHEGCTVRIRARQGVVFGSGGYAHNIELVKRYQPGLYGACAPLGSTGDFIAIAQEAGARMGILSNAFRSQVVLEEALKNRALALCAFQLSGDSMIVVNRHGRRIMNEKLNYQDRTPVHFVWDPVAKEFVNHLQFMIFDARSLDAFGGAFPIPADKRSFPYLIEAASLDDLATAIAGRLAKAAPHTGGVKLAADFLPNLRETLVRYNGFARSGRDLDFDRGMTDYDVDWHVMSSPMRAGTRQPANAMPNLTMHPIAEEGPYYGLILGAGALDTCSGPMVNEHGQILEAHGKPIPGFYGAGNCINSPMRAAYFGAGSTIGPALTFGHLAALHATAKQGRI